MKTDKNILDKTKKRKKEEKKVIEVMSENTLVLNTFSLQVVMVFYLGGVTMAEIAALRFLSQKEGSQESALSIQPKPFPEYI